jgi:4-amino-4-deoxy-L-arabinose transferase-like glycosyltransferase
MKPIYQLAQKPWVFIFCVFLYVLIVGLTFQKWLVPTFFNDFGSADGLLSYDARTFHTTAKSKAIEIISLGWAKWELRPDGHSPAGIASVFYALFSPSPVSVLPLNALIHAVTAYLVLKIIKDFFNSLTAVAGALIFAFNPFSFEWSAQIHRDGIFILGNILLLYIFNLILSRLRSATELKNVSLLKIFLLLLFGSFLVWLARPLWGSVSSALTIITLGLYLIATVGADRDSKKVTVSIILLLTIGFQIWLGALNSPEAESVLVKSVEIKSAEALAMRAENNKEALQNTDPLQNLWSRSEWIPLFMESRFLQIATSRRNSIDLKGGTAIDHDQQFTSAGAVIEYIPRALFVGLFSPFPEHWGGEGSTPALTLGRRVVGVLTFLSYPCLAGVLLLLLRKKEYGLWVLIFFCMFQILILALAFANVGTIMRYRFGFHNLLVALGFAMLFCVWLENKRSKTAPV